jgi:anti-sigma regulatory factor (Ser/Thr protein kinase)
MPPAFEACIPGTPLGVRRLRRELARVAEECGMDAEGIADVRLAVTEAATNAVIHAYADTQGELRVTAAIGDGELAIVIADAGPGMIDRDDSPGLGVGLAVIAHVSVQLRIVSDAGGTQVHMTFPCPNAASDAARSL